MSRAIKIICAVIGVILLGFTAIALVSGATSSETWFFPLFFGAFFSFVALVMHIQDGGQFGIFSRLMRLCTLWFDAKEKELQARAAKASKRDSEPH